MKGKYKLIDRQRSLKELQHMAAYVAEEIAAKVSPYDAVKVGDYRLAPHCYTSLESSASYRTLEISRNYGGWRAITDLGRMGDVAEVEGLLIPVADKEAFLFFVGHIMEIAAAFEAKRRD